jgi:hypothetical protein
MANQSETRLPKSVLDRIDSLRNLSKAHLNMLAEILRADDGKVFPVDLVILAVIQRSLRLIEGFTFLLERQNVLCAVPLIRLQIDSIMRLYACWLVADYNTVASRLLDGASLRRLKSTDGHSLTDSYLRQKVSEVYPFVGSVYDKTSGFIHLSTPHMLSPVKSISNRQLSISVGCQSTGRQWTEDEMVEAIDGFAEATKSLLHLCHSWLVTKKKGAALRQRSNTNPSKSNVKSTPATIKSTSSSINSTT